MSADGGPDFKTLMSVASATPSALDNCGWILNYSWIIPAVVVSLLYIVLLGFFVCLTDDLPFEALGGFFGIFRWARTGGAMEDISDG